MDDLEGFGPMLEAMLSRGMKFPPAPWCPAPPLWARGCGHVRLKGRWLVDAADVAAAGCRCAPWATWLGTAQAYTARAEEAALELLNRPPKVVYVEAECDRCPDLEAEVDRLKDVLGSVEWSA